PEANPYLDIFATHTYSDGVNPVPTSEQAQAWQRPASHIKNTGRPFWMTETSGYGTDWDGAMTMAFGIYTALRYGHVSGWVYYRLLDFLGQDMRPTNQYYAAKPYYRWVRPGAVRIETSCDDDEVHPLAFHHKDNNTLAIVTINYSGSSKTMNLTGNDLPSSMRMYRSTSSDKCVDAGAVAPSSVQLPGRSITTLFAENYNPVAIDTRATVAPRSVRRELPSGPVTVYGLDGRIHLRARSADALGDARLPRGGCLVVGAEGGTVIEHRIRIE
ncbi:MAG: hypothetical protein GF331_24400, partial [Chitinivibrionales bacterium]|nr:hypothetical protein [Chitinivibrionales bacterium]